MNFKTLLLATGIAFVCLQTRAQSKDPAAQEGSTGTVTFSYSGKKITLKTVRAKDGNIWLQQNLGSLAVAAGLKDPLSYGDLFQWGRWVDGHQQRDPVYSAHKELEPNNPSGLSLMGRNPFLYAGITPWWLAGKKEDKWEAAIPAEATATNGCDPCKALGADWRLPTIEEWIKLATVEEITDGSSGFNSSLKLSFSGERDWQGVNLKNVGYTGTYWSSTAANSTGGARVLLFDAEEINTKASYYRGAGVSIRCIKALAK